MKKRVAVAMSGGVDSSVAALLLKRQGYDVTGITMCFGIPASKRRKPACCGAQGINDARRVARKLKIRHFVLNFGKELERLVINDFLSEYSLGRTPNPCIRCNQFIKFDMLLKKVLALGIGSLATGHYAGIVKTRDGFRLKKGKDRRKDQSYFLYRLSQRQMRHIIFPLAGYSKLQVRRLAKRFSLSVADKKASQEICFLPQDDYRGFLRQRLKGKLKSGPIVGKGGDILARHRGIALYTIGQRSGLGIARGYPLYVTKIEPKGNRIVVGRREDASGRVFLIRDKHFIAEPLKKKVVLSARIRYNQKQVAATLVPLSGKIRVEFKQPQFAITPGQSAVFYDGETVVGGGIIDRVIV
ncbi:tRNA 2-thiouridine(34) synthase MnmA [Candidatus Omnitrophota bacterium]